MQTTSKSQIIAKERIGAIKRVLWTIFFLNIIVAAAKYLYGLYSGSTSMQADGIHSIFDALGNLVGLVGIGIASRPADESHPYGHAKFETYASLVIGLFLLLAAGEVGMSALAKLRTQDFSISVMPASFLVMICTLILNIFVALFERKRGNELGSDILQADASHTLSDVMVSLGVIVGLIFSAVGFPVADPIVALLVMIMILYTAVDVFKRSLKTLSDHVRIPESVLRDIVLSVPGVRNTHCIRTRGTESEVYVDLHILVSPTMSISKAHELSEEVEAKVMSEHQNVREVLVHIEPDDGHIE